MLGRLLAPVPRRDEPPQHGLHAIVGLLGPAAAAAVLELSGAFIYDVRNFFGFFLNPNADFINLPRDQVEIHLGFTRTVKSKWGPNEMPLQSPFGPDFITQRNDEIWLKWVSNPV